MGIIPNNRKAKTMSYNENKNYREFVDSTIESVKEDYFYPDSDMDLSDAIHQAVDSRVIYYVDQHFIMRETSNEDAYFDQMGEKIEGESYQEIVGKLAYFAHYQDVCDEIDFDRWESLRDYLEERRNRKAA